MDILDTRINTNQHHIPISIKSKLLFSSAFDGMFARIDKALRNTTFWGIESPKIEYLPTSQPVLRGANPNIDTNFFPEYQHALYL